MPLIQFPKSNYHFHMLLTANNFFFWTKEKKSNSSWEQNHINEEEKRKKETDILEVLLEIDGIFSKTSNIKSIITCKLSSEMRWIVVWDWAKPARPVRPIPRAVNAFNYK